MNYWGPKIKTLEIWGEGQAKGKGSCVPTRNRVCVCVVYTEIIGEEVSINCSTHQNHFKIRSREERRGEKMKNLESVSYTSWVEYP